MDVDLEDPIWVPYCEPKNMTPLTTYTPLRDFNVGDFVFMRPHDLDLVPLYMERAEGDVIKDEENENLKWWEFNGGFLWKKDQICMNDICMKIIGMGSGNVI